MNPIKEKRVELGITQSQLAERAHTRQSIIARIECDAKPPGIVLCKKLGEALNLDALELYDYFHEER